jgi:hypothetical protein
LDSTRRDPWELAAAGAPPRKPANWAIFLPLSTSQHSVKVSFRAGPNPTLPTEKTCAGFREAQWTGHIASAITHTPWTMPEFSEGRPEFRAPQGLGGADPTIRLVLARHGRESADSARPRLKQFSPECCILRGGRLTQV